MTASDPLELELQVVVSCLMWVLGTKLTSSVRVGQSLTKTEPSFQASLCVIQAVIVSTSQCWDYRHEPLCPALDFNTLKSRESWRVEWECVP